jgi:hypothetical protein
MRVGVDVEVLGRDTVHHGEGRIGRRGSLVRVAGDLERHRGRIRVSVGQRPGAVEEEELEEDCRSSCWLLFSCSAFCMGRGLILLDLEDTESRDQTPECSATHLASDVFPLIHIKAIHTNIKKDE